MNVTDDEIMHMFRVEYFNEWQNARKLGVEPSPKEIRKMLGIPVPKRKFLWFF